LEQCKKPDEGFLHPQVLQIKILLEAFMNN